MKLNGKCVRLFTDKHLENIESMFKTLYRDELLTDCTLHCRDGSIKVHKLILAASSPFFRKIFLDHDRERSSFIMYGVSFNQLRDLVELIYRGSIDVPSDTFNNVFDLAEELEITDVLVEDGSDTRQNGCGRDTRFKGQKRVAVDFITEENESTPSKVIKNPVTIERRLSSSSEKSTPQKKNIETNTNGIQDSEKLEEQVKEETNTNETSGNEKLMGHSVDEQSTLSVWARKERKFKCDLCPSSFKRASHLTRHQLVHTGERPYACNQCDKAFSRHDKLKHHIHKAHELVTASVLNEALPADSLYTIDHVRILTPEQTMVESPEPLLQTPSQDVQNPLSLPQKKGRGRPRKYPPGKRFLDFKKPAIGELDSSEPVLETPSDSDQNVLPLAIKRGRGRPRKYPERKEVPVPLIKRPRGRPRLNPIDSLVRRENYDISNMPYGDLEYLTKPLEEPSEEMTIEEQEIMEPLVEIKTEITDKPDQKKEVPEHSGSFLENIGLFENSAIAKIGECTISVASNSNPST